MQLTSNASDRQDQDLDILAEELILEYQNLEKLKTEFDSLKNRFLELLNADDIVEVNVSNGRILKCVRTTKEFSEGITNAEKDLKARKQYATWAGEYKVTKSTQYLRFI